MHAFWMPAFQRTAVCFCIVISWLAVDGACHSQGPQRISEGGAVAVEKYNMVGQLHLLMLHLTAGLMK